MARHAADRKQRLGHMSVAIHSSDSLPLVGGMEPVTLRVDTPPASGGAAFLEATLLPGRGMNVLQVRGRVPGLGEIDLLCTAAAGGET